MDVGVTSGADRSNAFLKGYQMNTRNIQLQEPKRQCERGLARSTLKALGTIGGIGALLLLSAQWPLHSPDAVHVVEPASATETKTPSPPLEYFPAQYRNAAGDRDEHIQAF
jgi:hypothetical protein